MTVRELARRILGALLLVLTLFPCYRLLASPETGRAGSYTISLIDIYSEFMYSGVLLVLPFALLAALLLRPDWTSALRARLALLERPRPVPFAAVLALLAGALALAFTLMVLEGVPNFIDSLAQTLQARYWADGRLTGPTAESGEFMLIQNSLFTPSGWVSQYPPGHVALLALGLRLGIVHAVGAILVALTVFFWTLFADRLLAHDRLAARLGAVLLALSPFLIFVGGSFMNHITVAAAVGIAAWAGLRALERHAAWALLSGLAIAFAFATRPLSSLAMGAAIALALPFAVGRTLRERRTLLCAALVVLGASPVLALLFSYNHVVFGGWAASGYAQALGPYMRLGFHLDPWGNFYGVKQAIAYTSADLITLSVNLLETPLPSVSIIGAFLLVARKLHPATRVFVAVALSVVASNFFYWHHGVFMGPRMLHESTPAWVFVFVIAALELLRLIPASVQVARLRARSFAAAALVLSTGFGLLVLAPQRAASYGGTWLEVTRVRPPNPGHPALVFVHDAWVARVAMTLAANGMRLDQVETLLRQNSTCRVHLLSVAHPDTAPRLLALLDTVPRADRLPGLVEIAPGDVIRATSGEKLQPECVRQVNSDRRGILDLAPLQWQGDLPHQEPTGALFVRDFGPERNREVLARYPGRVPYVFTMSAPDGEPVLVPYAEGMKRLWSTE